MNRGGSREKFKLLPCQGEAGEGLTMVTIYGSGSPPNLTIYGNRTHPETNQRSH
jgi:hypothetical protein